MRQFFAPNISGFGRWLRGVSSLACLAGAVYLYLHDQRALGLAFGAIGLFTLYEALRGWCVLRACGIKTKF